MNLPLNNFKTLIMQGNWILGFLGFMGIKGIQGFLSGNSSEAI